MSNGATKQKLKYMRNDKSTLNEHKSEPTNVHCTIIYSYLMHISYVLICTHSYVPGSY